jgi:hypothetical protein
MKKILLLALMAFTSVSYGQTFLTGSLGPGDPTFHPTQGSTAGSGVSYYDLITLTVSTTGAYVFELASVNTTGTPSNALDTLLVMYANIFNPAAPGAGIGFNDDFTGNRTVLPGPYAANGVTVASTGFTGANPGSRFTFNLTAGVTYFLPVTSFRDTTFVGTGTTAQPFGTWYLGANGPGTITIVPEPTTTALLVVAAAGGLGVLLRKRKSA